MLKSIISESIHIAINRGALQIASIIIIAIIGNNSSFLLASFNVSLTILAVLLSFLTLGICGIQGELSKNLSSNSNDSNNKLMLGGAYFILVYGLITPVLIFFLGDLLVSNIQTVNLRDSILNNLLFLSLCIIPVGFSTLIIIYNEVQGNAKLISKLKIFQIIVQIVLVILSIYIFSNSIENRPIIALAYVASDIIFLLMLMYFFNINKNILFFVKPSFNDIFYFMKLSVPAGIGSIIQRGIFVILIGLLAVLGVKFVAATYIMISAVALFTLPMMGLSAVLAIFIGKNRTNKNNSENKEFLINFILLTIFELAFIAVIFSTIGNSIYSIFTKDSQVISILNNNTLPIVVYTIMNSFLFIAMGVARGYSNNTFPQVVIGIFLGLIFFSITKFQLLEFHQIIILFSFLGIVSASIIIIKFILQDMKSVTSRV